ncbi:uncharacterized conserved secreted protein (DUF3747) [Synechococcus sp. A15-62]|uniref:DUF3747 domain-containing protein n=1 Tax=Synechococcus sp. A15-62 TaxID=1050657 RepID=UPI0016481B68|nr:DUF3747 domain-containing protein [Synechococcus sp. A15-62]QNJ01448.1 uncharacterized conserved secreted protein (DUF3747) [Synechococcus sp. A15-62]
MSRTYLRAAGLTAVGLLATGLSQESTARALFDSAAVPEKHFAVLAQPIGRAQWKLLVLEQVKAQPRCWRARQDGLVEPSLNRFNFSGICKRYLDSNGYSLRSGGQDLGTRFRFRLKRSGTSLKLEALDPQQRAPLLVGQAKISKRDPNGFVALQLEPGWALERRVYQGRPLNHLYFAHQEPVNRLLALASRRGHRSGFSRLGAPMAPITPPPLPAATASRRRTARLASTAPIRLQVIPFRR